MKMSNNKLDKLFEVICLIMVVGVPLYLFFIWGKLPDEVPLHYDLAGTVDRWGKKGEFLFLPITTIIMYMFISFVECFPKFWNTGVTVTEENRERVYRILKSMIKSVKLIVVADFSYMALNTIMCKNLPIWFTPVLLLLLFGDITFWLVRLVKVK